MKITTETPSQKFTRNTTLQELIDLELLTEKELETLGISREWTLWQALTIDGVIGSEEQDFTYLEHLAGLMPEQLLKELKEAAMTPEELSQALLDSGMTQKDIDRAMFEAKRSLLNLLGVLGPEGEA
jgi:hypothetical protein